MQSYEDLCVIRSIFVRIDIVVDTGISLSDIRIDGFGSFVLHDCLFDISGNLISLVKIGSQRGFDID
ncbi:hypothetical protein D3C86_1159780 [compost metagenome]